MERSVFENDQVWDDSRRFSQFYKKTLLYFICLIDLNKLFTNQKSGSEHFKQSSISKNTRNNYIAQLKTKKVWKMNKLELCKDLKLKSLSELISMISAGDLQFYLWISRILIDKSNKKDSFTYCSNSKNVITFKINSKERRELICSKSKRKEEVLKFSFKFLKKGILEDFKMAHGELLKSRSSTKKLFNTKMLNDDPRLVKQFCNYKVSKMSLGQLKKIPVLKKLFEQQFQESFVLKGIQEVSSRRHEEMMNDTLSVDEFLNAIYMSQQKNALSLQDILSMFQIFGNCFLKAV